MTQLKRSKQTQSSFSISRIIIISLVIVVVAMDLIVAFASLRLRPIADDYCLGVWGSEGLVQGVSTYFLTWSSQLITVISNIVFVGLPVAMLPWSLASAFTLWVAILLLALLVSWLYWMTHARSSYLVIQASILFLSQPILWISYWYFTVQLQPSASNIFIVNSVTHWQNINAAYVIISIILTALWTYVFIFSRIESRKWLLGFTTGIGGLVTGLTSPVFGLILLILLLVALIIGYRQYRRCIHRLWFTVSFATIGTLLGVAVSVFGPGTQSRSGGMAISPLKELPFTDLVLELTKTPLYSWLQALLTPGIALVFLTGFLFGSFLPPMRSSATTIKLGSLFWIMVLLSFLSAFVNRLSEYFAYPEPWHVIPTYVFLYIASILGGLLLGELFSESRFYRQWLPLCLAALVVFIAANSVLAFSNDVSDRLARWEIGPAPAGPIADIDDPDGWQRSCWDQLSETRDAPPRYS